MAKSVRLSSELPRDESDAEKAKKRKLVLVKEKSVIPRGVPPNQSYQISHFRIGPSGSAKPRNSEPRRILREASIPRCSTLPHVPLPPLIFVPPQPPSGSPNPETSEPQRIPREASISHNCSAMARVFFQEPVSFPPLLFVSGQPQRTVHQLQSVFRSVPSFVYVNDRTVWLIFNGSYNMTNPIGTPIVNPRVLIEISDSTVHCHFEVHFHRLESFEVAGNESKLSDLINSLHHGSGYVLCCGIPKSVSELVTFESKQLRRWSFPFSRIDHTKCQLWYKSDTNGRKEKAIACQKCSRLRYHLLDMIKRKQLLSPETKRRRTLANSKYPIRYLSPSDRVAKEKNVASYLLTQKRIVKKHDVDVGDLTNKDLISQISDLEHTSKSLLEKVLAEADVNGKEDTLGEDWKEDVTERLEFVKDQDKDCK